MDDNFGLKNTVDLYKRLLPALNSKRREIERLKINNIKNEDKVEGIFQRFIKKEDIWNYLIKYKWETVTGLKLSDMVDDILNIDNQVLINNITKLKKENNTNIEAL